MAQEFTISSLDAFLAEYAHLIEILYVEAKCGRWELSREAFAESLRRSLAKRFDRPAAGNRGSFVGAHPGARHATQDIDAFLKTLYLEDLALACACSAGIETAWEFFVAEFRSGLRSAALAILRTSGSGNNAGAEDLADSLFAELYGLHSTSDGHRKSLFEYFHGRSKLSTWLRAVLAQRHVDLLRAGGKTISLDAERQDEPPHDFSGRVNPVPSDPRREKYLARLDCALSTAFSTLSSRERMILTCYYVDKFTLAEIGRIVGDHESTVSRQLERVRRALRESVTQQLLHGVSAQDGCAAEPALDQAQIDLVFEYAVEDWPFDLSRVLSKQDSAPGPPES